MLHIVFSGSETGLLQDVIKLDETLSGEVITFRDDFAVGPLTQIETDEGWAARRNWWNLLLKNSPYEKEHVIFFDDRDTLKKIGQALQHENGEQVWIWMGQNQHDVCGFYWLSQYFKEFQGKVFIIYLNNLPFLNEKGQLFYPSRVHEIQPRELLKAKRLARAITSSEFEVDPDEWKRLCTENGMVRILEGGKKIVSMDETFYDGDILKNLTAEWQKANRVLMNTLHRMKIKTGDVFIMWRIKQLIGCGKISVMGDMNKAWKDFDIRMANNHVETPGIETSVATS